MNETTTTPPARKPVAPSALLTDAVLDRLGACQRGRIEFRKHYPNGLDISDARRVKAAVKKVGGGMSEWIADSLSYKLDRISPEVHRVASDYQDDLYRKWGSAGTGAEPDTYWDMYGWPWIKYVARQTRRTGLLVILTAEAVRLGYTS